MDPYLYYPNGYPPFQDTIPRQPKPAKITQTKEQIQSAINKAEAKRIRKSEGRKKSNRHEGKV